MRQKKCPTLHLYVSVIWVIYIYNYIYKVNSFGMVWVGLGTVKKEFLTTRGFNSEDQWQIIRRDEDV